MRGRTIRKRQQRLIAERRTQSVTRVEILPNKEDSSSVVEECPNSEQMESRTAVKVDPQRRQQQQFYHKTPAAIGSPCSHHKRTDRKQVLDEDDARKGKTNFHIKRDLLCDDGFTHIYTLYRDEDGNIRQAPANECHCKHLLKKLEGQMKATQKELRLHILTVQERVNSRMGKKDEWTRHQIKLLDVPNKERAAAERKNMIYRMEWRAAQDREEALKTQQAAVSHELKRWWMSHMKDMDVHIPANGQYYKLLPSPSVEQSEGDADLESLPLLSVVSGDSSTSLTNYVNILPSKSAYSLGSLEHGQMGGGGARFPSAGGFKSVSRGYSIDTNLIYSTCSLSILCYVDDFFPPQLLSDDYENTALFPLPTNHISDAPQGSADHLWQRPVVQDGPVAAVVPLYGEGISSSSSQSSISEQGPGLIPQQEHRYDRKHFGDLTSPCRHEGIHTDSTRTLQCFIEPTEPSFKQERNYLHAMEVTQHFFDTVSTQLERWYERKLVEVKQQMELKAQQDRKELLQRISLLEEELERLKINESAESYVP
ncbi:ankyrin repeat domain-containing protein 6-like [Scophthalmus maximus]|uniref:ankyrin repeat domain-containing protein 6-like n=1 Tax=Scophthalmus maximus TaxID=52904 RepID=UPI001FA8339F|nr:ankyrin repeat domain-containing protein 6-like [Scophthalmus maximus]